MTQHAQHSPGPFRVVGTRSGGWLILDCIGDSIGSLAGRTGDHPAEEQEANARLFAGSWTMAEALRLILARLEEGVLELPLDVMDVVGGALIEAGLAEPGDAK